jgi:hypothetical protein
MTNAGIGNMMNNGIIRVYGGTMPESPDLAVGTTLLATITTDGLPFTPGDNSNGAGLKLLFVPPAALTADGDWVLKGVASGTATWWRWCWTLSDSLLASTYFPRIDGDVSATGALVLTATSITSSTQFTINSFTMTFPTE